MQVSRGQGMRRQVLVVLAVLAATALLASLLPTRSRGAVRSGAARADVIVRFAPTVPVSQRRASIRAAGGTVTRDLHIIDGLGARMTLPAAQRLRTAMGVVSVTPAAPVQARTGGIDFAKVVGAVRARQQRGVTGDGVGVAVIDTGVDGDLPDFQVSRHDAASRVIASAVVNPAATGGEDGYGHGTHVAGIIAGDGSNRNGTLHKHPALMGVAPGANLVSVKIADDQGRATTLDAIYGLQFAVDHARQLGIRVVNLSFASAVAESSATDPLDAAAEAAWLHGLVVVAAAGNEGSSKGAVQHAPGNDPYVITVGATDDDDATTPWSSHGETQGGVEKPEVVAPGSGIVSTLAPGSVFAQECPDCVVADHYFRAGGTSMATAVVSGASALLLEAHPNWTPDQVKAALVGTAQPVPGGDEIRVDRAIAADPDAAAATQTFPLNRYIDPATGGIDYAAASWRAASWRSDTDGPAWAAASWRCDCSLDDDGAIDPQAASWRAAAWRTSFTK